MCGRDRDRDNASAFDPGKCSDPSLAGTNDVSAVLPVIPAIILIILSVILTLLGGLLPSKKAAKSDPVTALRTE